MSCNHSLDNCISLQYIYLFELNTCKPHLPSISSITTEKISKIKFEEIVLFKRRK